VTDEPRAGDVNDPMEVFQGTVVAHQLLQRELYDGVETPKRGCGCPERRSQPLRTTNPLADRVSEDDESRQCRGDAAEISLRVGGSGWRESARDRVTTGPLQLWPAREIDAVDECVPRRRLACWSSEIEEEDWAWVRMDGVGSMTPKMRADEVSPGCGRLEPRELARRFP
jgi:hypothetical protein